MPHFECSHTEVLKTKDVTVKKVMLARGFSGQERVSLSWDIEACQILALMVALFLI